MESHCVAQASLELLGSSSSPALASQSAGITGMSHHTRTSVRVLCVKEVEILGLMSVDWQCPFEDFVFPPSVSENMLKISVKEQGLFHKKDSAGQGCVRKVYLKDAATAERAYKAIEDAQSTRQQQKLVKQSSMESCFVSRLECSGGISAHCKPLPPGFKRFSCLSLLSSWDYRRALPCPANIFCIFSRVWFHHRRSLALCSRLECGSIILAHCNESWLTATSTCQVQVIFLPQPPEYLGL
ncbi:Vacuolar protein sorting-associated protein 13C, partial [Plecturocebus cupreus]